MPYQLENLADHDSYFPCDHALDCPQCGPSQAPYLHMRQVFSVEGETVRIEYQCENCGGISTLNLEQTKGQTLLHWTPDYKILY